MTSLDESPARLRDFNLTTHDTHNRQTSIPLVGFEHTTHRLSYYIHVYLKVINSRINYDIFKYFII